MFSHIFKNSLRPIIKKNTYMTNTAAKLDYQSWDKKDLIAKIMKLEGTETPVQRKTKSLKVDKDFDYLTRKVVIKFSYLGYNYSGLAYQADTDVETVEETIFRVLKQKKFIKDYDPKTLAKLNFSRCGRTDKGVSAMNQVISLDLRSCLKTQEEIDNRDNDVKEINYIKALNGSLPNDIWLHSVSLNCDSSFDARFSCAYRHYRYYFKLEKHMNLESMREGCRNFLGVDNDFRNFCKIDGSKQIVSYKRTIIHCDIILVNEHEQVYCLDLKGSAFLWHQVRCMMAVLFEIAEGHEQPSIIKNLMDVENQYPSKPDYTMANDTPLVLYDCIFKNEDDIKWMRANDFENSNETIAFKKATNDTVYSVYYQELIKLEMSKNLIKFNIPECITFDDENRKVSFDKKAFGSNYINLGDGKHKRLSKLTPFHKRNRQRAFEEVNQKWRDKKKAKKESS